MIKKLAKGVLTKGRQTQYNKLLKEKSDAYNVWQHENEKVKVETAGALYSVEADENGAVVSTKLPIPDVRIVKFAGIWEHELDDIDDSTILIFVSPKGKLVKNATEIIRNYFINHPGINVVYADEDEARGNGKYVHPYFKPDWSPDAYLNCDYIGSIFACRAFVKKQAATEYDNAIRMLGGTRNYSKNSPESVGLEASLLAADVLFCMLAIHEHAFAKRTGIVFPIGHIQEILFHRNPEVDVFYGRAFHASTHMLPKPTSISIVIPSKDHPEVLLQCIMSIVNTTNDKNIVYDITVLDNGSSAVNRVKYGGYISKVPRQNGLRKIQYLYETKEFNFAEMCNKGAKHSRGELILFLNDDIEATTDGWLRELAAQALLRHVGCVGAKLLYPEDDYIQHCGIANLRLGPVHKLARMHDRKSYYFGYNRGIHNFIGVTGACLMIQRSKFNSMGGFYEGLPVAFNDVDLCYRAFETGYYNVCINYLSLIHHESLSRGIDSKDAQKLNRLAKEHEILMSRHEKLYNFDPYYSHLLVEEDTVPAIYPREDFIDVATLEPEKVIWHEGGIKGAREDGCLRIGVEYSGSFERFDRGILNGECDDGYYFKGYSFVIGSDNACFEKLFVLRRVGRSQAGAGPLDDLVYSVPVYTGYRPDIKVKLQDQVNVDMTGFKVRIAKGELPRGIYQMGMVAIDKTSRLKLINWVPNVINIKA